MTTYTIVVRRRRSMSTQGLLVTLRLAMLLAILKAWADGVG